MYLLSCLVGWLVGCQFACLFDLLALPRLFLIKIFGWLIEQTTSTWSSNERKIIIIIGDKSGRRNVSSGCFIDLLSLFQYHTHNVNFINLNNIKSNFSWDYAHTHWKCGIWKMWREGFVDTKLKVLLNRNFCIFFAFDLIRTANRMTEQSKCVSIWIFQKDRARAKEGEGEKANELNWADSFINVVTFSVKWSV